MFGHRRAQRERDLDRELRSDLEIEAEEQMERGLSPEEARWAAQRAFGNTVFLMEEVREMWGWTSLQRLWQDLTYAARIFRRNPAFVTVAAVSLALGIGANSAMFALVNTLLIRPLPYSEADRLVRLTGVYPKAGLALFQEQSRTMDVASVTPGAEFNLTGAGDTVRVMGSTVSDNLFSVLRAPAQVGQTFGPGARRPGADGSIVLSDRLWVTTFGGDPQVIGRTIRVNDIPRQIVGVMPAAFSFPSNNVAFWIPARLDPTDMENYWGGEYFPLLARLRPGVSVAQAAGETRALMERLRPQFPFPMPRNWNGDATAVPLQAAMVGEFRGKLWILFASVAIVLAIACANVASLLFSRASARRKEIALRVALGAGRLRIVRQFLTESVFLSALGAAIGLVVGSAALLALSRCCHPKPLGSTALASIGRWRPSLPRSRWSRVSLSASSRLWSRRAMIW